MSVSLESYTIKENAGNGKDYEIEIKLKQNKEFGTKVVTIKDEDDVSGAISHERFLKLSAEYEAEQRELILIVSGWQVAVDTHEQDKYNFQQFFAVVRNYVGIKELTPTIVNELIQKIVVHAPNKSSGKRTQKVDIIFNFIGEVDLPDNPQDLKTQVETA